jgi:exosortase/archaeosortase family protein
MKYLKTLTLRLLLALIIAFSFNLFYIILNPLTFNLTYLLLKIFTNPILSINTILINSFTLKFIPACAAASAYLLLALLILLTKDIELKKGIKMFFLGSLLILIMNLTRILILIFILMNYGKDYFNLIHVIFWKIISSVFVVIVWVYLTNKFKIKSIPIYSDIKTIIKS